MKQYENYVFDLYGTLVDVRVDEHSPKLWRVMADDFNAYGTNWEPEKLEKKFFELDKWERDNTKKKIKKKNEELDLNDIYAEVVIERVIAKCLLEAPSFHKSEMRILGKTLEEYLQEYKNGVDVVEEISKSDWAEVIAVNFRTVSREYIRLYDDTIAVLEELNKRGKGVYLLSNAIRAYTMPEFEQLGISKYFKKIRISSDYEIMKPQKDFLEGFIEEEGMLKEETVMVGNEIESDMKIAHFCGVDGIMHNTMKYTEKEMTEKGYKFEVIDNLGGLL